MRLLHLLRRHPLAVLGFFALAFVVWLWQDTIPSRDPYTFGPNPDPRLAEYRSPRPATDLELVPPIPTVPPGVEQEKAKPNPRETAQVLSKLKAGMTRAEVEHLVGVPAAQDIHPATVADGRVTYYTTYEADLMPPSTVRPIFPRRPMPMSDRNSQLSHKTVISLEFDATKPGHPLLGIYYPDPLF